MISYVIIAFVAILIGMAISVSAFGTGGKRKKIFQDIYFSIEDVDGIGVLYTKTGEYSAILKMENPVQKYSVNPAKRNVLDLKNETCKNREKRNVLKNSRTRHFKTTKKQSKTGCFYSF